MIKPYQIRIISDTKEFFGESPFCLPELDRDIATTAPVYVACVITRGWTSSALLPLLRLVDSGGVTGVSLGLVQLQVGVLLSVVFYSNNFLISLLTMSCERSFLTFLKIFFKIGNDRYFCLRSCLKFVKV